MTENEVMVFKVAENIRKLASAAAESVGEGQEKPSIWDDIREQGEAAIGLYLEVQQYRAIGTPKECREAMERQKARKPITHKGTNRADCPICGATVRGIKEPFGGWCSKCGQRISWEHDGKGTGKGAGE